MATSGNAIVNVTNIGRDVINHVYNDVGADGYAVMDSIERRLKVIQDEQLDNRVHVWLSAPDVSQSLNAACKKRHAGTGAWFLDCAQFAQWVENPNTVMCIYGAPGCGKTVLCASIIEAVKALCTSPLSGRAYFFFESRNPNFEGLVSYENFLRSILSQLCSRLDGVPEAVQAMYRSHGKGRESPSVQALEGTLRQVIGAFDDVYIVIDSLDECGDKPQLLKWIKTVASWNSANCHLLATTRAEPDIENLLTYIAGLLNITLQGAALEQDIGMYLEERLSFITSWSEEIKNLVKAGLVSGAGEAFRWVATQMDILESCKNMTEVKEKLETLPRELQHAYGQIIATSPTRQAETSMMSRPRSTNDDQAPRQRERTDYQAVGISTLIGNVTYVSGDNVVHHHYGS